MENNSPDTNTTRSKTQRLIPLTLQIISAMSHLNTSTSSLTCMNGVSEGDQFKSNIPKEQESNVNSVVQNTSSHGSIKSNISINSLEVVHDPKSNLTSLDSSYSIKSSTKNSSRDGFLTDNELKKKILVEWNLSVLNKRIFFLEEQMNVLLNTMPEWTELQKLENFKVDYNKLIEMFSEYVTKAYNTAFTKTNDDEECFNNK